MIEKILTRGGAQTWNVKIDRPAINPLSYQGTLLYVALNYGFVLSNMYTLLSHDIAVIL